MTLFNEVYHRALNGSAATVDEAITLAQTVDLDTLCDAADEIRRRNCHDTIDTCSIINARSGRCSEDCKWCAQSRFHTTGIDEYDLVPLDHALALAEAASKQGVKRLALVTSGRRVSPQQIEQFCHIYRAIAERYPNLYLCASMGLIGADELRQLAKAGVKRYHCNLETGPEYFPTLCTTHTQQDKLRTIAMAREAGLEVCSGGIIGMGESLNDRLQMAEAARLAGAQSIPINILQPIKGTPLADTPLISEEDVALTVALIRFVAPKMVLRFAGGRARLSEKALRRILRGGMNGAMIGDLLTTIGSRADDDHRLFASLGYR